MTDGDAKAAGRKMALPALPSRRFMIATLAILAILKLTFLLRATVFPDEAYYWMWGQYPALSYHDHPPLLAWTQAVVAEVFGWNRFALRIGTVPSFLLLLVIVVHWTRRLAGPGTRDAGLAAALVVMASPLFFVFQTISFPDHLLIALVLTACHFFLRFSMAAHDGDARPVDLYAAAAAIGLAGLTKYNALFAGLGMAGWFLASRDGRRLLATPHPWLAGLLSVAIVTPVFIWNQQHGWPSFRYNLHDRIDLRPGSAVGNLSVFVCLAGATFSLFLLPALFRMLFLAAPEPRLGRVLLPGRIAFWLSSLFFLFIGSIALVQYYWNIVAVLFLLPVLTLFITGRGELRAHALAGIVVAALLTFSYTVLPATTLAGFKARDIEITYGWTETARRVSEAEEAFQPDAVFGGDYRIAALLGFAMKRRDILSIKDGIDQYDYWSGTVAPDWKTALVLDDIYSPLEGHDRLKDRKKQVLGHIDITRFGRKLHRLRLVYLPPEP